MKTFTVPDTLAAEWRSLLVSKLDGLRAQRVSLEAAIRETEVAIAQVDSQDGAAPQPEVDTAQKVQIASPTAVPMQANGKMKRGVAERLIRDALAGASDFGYAAGRIAILTGCNVTTTRRVLKKFEKDGFAIEVGGFWHRVKNVSADQQAA